MVMANCVWPTLLLLILASVGARGEEGQLQFTNAAYDENTNTYEYQVTINQNILVNETILTVHCNNTHDSTASITYSLPPSHTGTIQYFTIDSHSGEVKLAVDSLTLDNGVRYNTQVRCLSQSSTTTLDLTASLRVLYEIQNEFPPVFSVMSQLMLWFVENNDISGENGIIYRFNATDSDRRECGVIQYTITSKNTDQFQIDSTTGILSFVHPLDRETREQHTVSIRASNPSPNCLTTPQMVARVSVDIRVNDTNDTPPRFSEDVYFATIPENTAERINVVSLSCTDQDLNSRLIFSMQQVSGPFFIDPAGNILVEEPIDYEVHPSFSFLVFCRDERGGEDQITNATVHVDIIPINEHRPTIEPSTLTVTISDVSPAGTVLVSAVESGSGALGKYTVTDRDTGSNHSEYTLTISRIDENFEKNFDLDRKTGVLSLKQMFVKDVCGQDNGNGIFAYIQVQITACDVSDLSACAILTVNVYVLTSNCSVFFPSSAPRSISLSELTPPGTNVLSISCEDYSNITNKTVTLISRNQDLNFFSFSQENKTMKLLRQLDYETKNFLSLTLFCKNTYNTNASVEILIRVLPENEYPPVLEESVYIVKLNRSIPSYPWPVRTIRASDRDRGVGGNITYSLAEPNHYLAVSSDGRVMLLQDLPKSETVFSVTVQVSDGNFSVNATVVVIQQLEAAKNYEQDFITVIIVFSCILTFLVVLLAISWVLVCCKLRRQGRKKKKRYYTYSGPNNGQNMDMYNVPDGQSLALNSSAFSNDPACKSSTLQSCTKTCEPEYETIVCKAQMYSEPCALKNARKNHLNVAPTNSTDCYVSMKSSCEALTQTSCTANAENKPLETAAVERSNSYSIEPEGTHGAGNGVGDFESSLEFCGAVETSLEFSGARGISLDIAGATRAFDRASSPRLASATGSVGGGNFEVIKEEGDREIVFTNGETN